ncbi:efflux RND transporter permease subunit [Hyphobacterium sp. CCMP332]|nr:efflux RND transporter permease subunit [Hyphobacterium sp. CCMP332]
MKEKDKNLYKEFGLTTFALNNRTTVFVLTFIIALTGVISYITLAKENFPEVEEPTIYIGTAHPGNSPEDMENLITRPIEKEINTISEVEEIRSTSVQDFSTIIVKFQAEMDAEEALQKVKDAVDKSKSELPADLQEDPNIFKMEVSEFPIMNINLAGDYNLDELKSFAEYLEDEIEKISEISKAEIRGVDDKEVKIKVNPYEMESRKISFRDIEDAVVQENLSMSGGNILTDGIRRTIRVLGEYEDPKQMEDIVVKYENNKIVYLKDIAKVEFGYVEKQNYARLGGESVVMVDVIKRSGENLLDATDKIYKIIEKAQEETLPKDLVVTITNDQSIQTRDQVNELENSIISGVILVVIVLLFFLGTRNALFVGMAIPLSMFMAFLIISMIGYTINMMILFGLIMALGMLVDNGIVVVENVYRLMEEGFTPIEAAKKGVGEVALPIISSTATTLAAFLPLAFWPGIMGEFMKYLPITLIITLGSSLFVALVINPVFISKYMKIQDQVVINKPKARRDSIIILLIGLLIAIPSYFADLPLVWLGNLLILLGILIPLNVFLLTPLSDRFQSIALPFLEKIYVGTLRYAVTKKRPYLFFGGTVLTLIASIMIYFGSQPNVIFFPINQPKYVNVFIEFPVGTDISTTNDFSEKIEDKLFEIIKPYEHIVESVISNVGQGTSDPNDPSSMGASDTPNKARLTVNFVEFKERGELVTSEIMNEIRDKIGKYPGITITVDKDAAGPPVGKPINIEISGEDYTKLSEIVANLKNEIALADIDGIEKLKSDLEDDKPELIVDIDREKARRFGLSTATVASEIRTALFGKEISKYKEGEDDYDVELRLDDQFRYDLDALMNKEITYRNQVNGKIVQIPIASVADVQYSSTFGSIKRKDLNRVVTLSSNVLDGYNATEINNQIRGLVRNMPIPSGYNISFTGEQENQAKEMAFLLNALMLAVFMIFLIIVSQFNKISAPFIIMTSVLFSTIGVFLGLVAFNMDFIVIMTMIGIISLAGIVVNNAIVLIDFIELMKARKIAQLEEGQPVTKRLVQAAIIEAGKTRLRPVLLTAITTVLGLIPLAVGLNINFETFFAHYEWDFFLGGDNVIFWGPMSWTIIFGLTFSTFLTLVIVPVMYLITSRIRTAVGRAA